MTLEDFEKSLAAEKDRDKSERTRNANSRHRSRHHHHRHHHRSSRDRDYSDEDRSSHHHRHKRSRRAGDDYPRNDSDDRHERKHRRSPRCETTKARKPADDEADEKEDEWVEKEASNEDTKNAEGPLQPALKRDTWMEAPSALDVDYVQRGVQRPREQTEKQLKPDFNLSVHKNELNTHLKDLAEGKGLEDIANEPSQHDVDYTFGDAGSKWRMTKLKAIYRQAEETGKRVEEFALERYGDLRSFDDAREEQIELDRRETYGEGYVGKEKPSGELFQERKLDYGIRRNSSSKQEVEQTEPPQGETFETEPAPTKTLPLDQSALNRLKAQMMKAKLRRSSDAARLEAEYNDAMAVAANRKDPGVVVLGTMESRLLADRKGEVKAVHNKRGRERGLVEENEDMSIEDMVRAEKRSRGQAGGEGQRFAEQIAKDGRFTDDLDYMDDNAEKLAKRVQKSEINLKNMAISDFQKMNRILDTCPLCHHEDTNTPPIAPVVSLATRVYLTLPTEPELADGGACIVPIQHRLNLLECDDDEWEEMRNFMKCLTRMYHEQGRDVVFYENAARPERKRHAAMEVVPLPYSLGETAPAFFREAILSSDEEWTQHRKLIDTLARAKNQGLGKLAFRRSLAKEMPYFHVWFELDGGLGHIVEDPNRWPKGDLFAREIIGGMLDADPTAIKRQGRWQKGGDRRVEGFKKRWRSFDWTRILTEGQ
ncbi:hypothetical protein L228DRAFT_226233 [Xylona heveae TC161]|uniref:Cell cycle control protein n=1 Tax=Xylona heveae (strain CBS 132557 / TC161) TaxID=1328760 RepID=A0A165JLT5_XYLHT|nr:hypothetical protein L228DRAFT_226233 [Xylona heveae TC161]KZF26401.1 hypothetical protein L228DRAFT_226233 [Xylona heveae TC161]